MKKVLAALCSVALLTSCAGIRVVETQVATGATNPQAIYIKPFQVTGSLKGRHGGSSGEMEIRSSLAGEEFADALKRELAKLAPSAVVQPEDEIGTGWVVDGEIELLDAGSRSARLLLNHTYAGRSSVVIHVRITDNSGRNYSTGKSKESSKVIYEFTLAGGSAARGAAGSIYNAGLGQEPQFDFKNAAERVMLALSKDPYRFGERVSPVAR